MASLRTTFTYDSDVESVFGLISDPEFRRTSCEAQGSVEHDVSVEPVDGGAKVTITRLQEAAVPDFVKKFTGQLARVTQTEVWSAPDAQGRRSATLTVDIVGRPAGMKGTATLADRPEGGTEFTVTGDVKVAVPFLGKRLEGPIADAIVASVRQDVELGQARL